MDENYDETIEDKTIDDIYNTATVLRYFRNEYCNVSKLGLPPGKEAYMQIQKLKEIENELISCSKLVNSLIKFKTK